MSAASRRREPDADTALSHLARRFFAVLRARPLSDEEAEYVRSLLGPVLERPFFEQAPVDQRHGLEAARYVGSAGVDDPSAVVAALLHDVGKRHARLGVPGRVFASLLIKTRLPMSPSFRVYRDHGRIASEELRGLGAPDLAIDFAAHHHGSRPETIDTTTWEILIASDSPAKTGDDAGAGISSTPR